MIIMLITGNMFTQRMNTGTWNIWRDKVDKFYDNSSLLCLLIKGLLLYVSFNIVINLFMKISDSFNTRFKHKKWEKVVPSCQNVCCADDLWSGITTDKKEDHSCEALAPLLSWRLLHFVPLLICCWQLFNHQWRVSMVGKTLQLLRGLICKDPNKQSTLFGEARVWDDDEYLRINTNMGKQN